MSSRFAALVQSDDSDSDESTHETMKVSAPQKNVPTMPQAHHYNNDHFDAGEFCAVPKKKAVSGKVSADVAKKQNTSNIEVQPQAHHAAGHANGKMEDSRKSPKNQQGAGQRAGGGMGHQNGHRDLQQTTAIGSNGVAGSPNRGGKKKNKGNNPFAALDIGSDEDENDESEEDYEEHVELAKPMLPKQIGLTNQSSIPDYFAVTHIESTLPSEEQAKATISTKKFKKEVLLFSVLFINTTKKKVEFEFERVVLPTAYKNPILSKQTTEMCGLTDDSLIERKAQPLDEVLREFDRFLKDKNLVSANRNKKKASTKFSQVEQEFQVITCGPSCIADDLKSEMERKGLIMSNYFKKFVDIRKIFSEYYGMQEELTLHEILDKICEEFEGSPHIHDARNIAKIATCMLGDIPQKLVPNQILK